MRARAVLALIAAIAIVAGVVWTSQRGGGSGPPKGSLVTVGRGEVAVTVGGIGHVDTLTGAARLAVPASASPATSSTGTATTPAAATASSSGGTAQAPAGAVFPQVAGHVTRLLVRTGDRVAAGQAIATIADDGATAGNLLQARSELSTARLELAQKRVQDPARGVPPTAAEVAAGRQAVRSARDKLARLVGPPLPADVATARSDLAKAIADLQAARAGGPEAVAAAELAVATAHQKLALLTGAPDPADVAAAQLELAKATLDQETLLTPPTPSAAAVRRRPRRQPAGGLADADRAELAARRVRDVARGRALLRVLPGPARGAPAPCRRDALRLRRPVSGARSGRPAGRCRPRCGARPR